MAIRNEPPVGPAPQYPERDRQTYDVDQASETRRVSQGLRLAEEQLVKRGNLLGAFAGDLSGQSERRYTAEIRDDRHSPLGDGGPATRGPVWANVDRAAMAGFMQGTHGAEQSVTVKPYRYAQREGANDTITPLDALTAGERPGTIYQYKIRPENGGRGRSNPAAVFGSEDVR